MDRQAARVVVYAWGKSYVDRLLNYALASLLAPGNLPALAASFDTTVMVVTEEQLFSYVDSHPVIERAKSICAVRLVSLDDLIGEPWQYGISLAYALFRGFCDLGAAMTETYMLFLNADFVLADGSYQRLIPYMLRGDSVLLSPSYCVVEEEVEPLLEDIRRAENGILAIPPRRLARMIIDHRHNTVRAKTISQQSIHFEYMDQAYWQVDDDTIIAHQMPVCMVAMRPEQALSDINTFWDWGITYEFCPSRKLTAIGDSDEFLLLELRSENTHSELVRPGPTTPLAAASRMHGYITQYQLDNARLPMTLHAAALPERIDDARVRLRGFVDELLQHLPACVPDHCNHTQWIYHRWHLTRYMEIRRLRREIAAIDEESEKDGIRARKMQDGALLMLAATLAPEFAAIYQQAGDTANSGAATATVGPSSLADGGLAAIAEKYRCRAGAVEKFFQHDAEQSAIRQRERGEPLQRQLCAVEGRALTLGDLGYCGVPAASIATAETVGSWSRQYAFRILRRVRVWALGPIPHTRPWHPLHFVCKDIARMLDSAALDGSRLLLVSGENGIAARWTDPVRRQHLRISPGGVLSGALDAVAVSVRFGFCFVELDREDFHRIREIHRVLASRLEPGGGLMMCWINSACEPHETLQEAFSQCALMISEGARVRFFSSASGWGGLDVARAGREQSGLSRWARRGAALLRGFLRIGGRRPIESRNPQPNCWAAVVEIGGCTASSAPANEAPFPLAIEPSARAAEAGAMV
jgi:cytochrome c551/c552